MPQTGFIQSSMPMIPSDEVSNWLNLNKLSLNTTKTKAMIFHTAQREVCKPHLKMENHTIEFVESFNLLGIVIDSKLKWG